MKKQGLIKKILAKHRKINCAKCGVSDLSHSIEMELIEKELIEAVKAEADYDGDVYTGDLLGEMYTKDDYHNRSL